MDTPTGPAARWTSPYRPDPAHPHHLVNDEGQHLFILGKTAWTFFACADPEGVCRRAARQGITVLRVTLNGSPYWETLGQHCWPWGGTPDVPDYSRLNEEFFQEACRRADLARAYGLGLDVVLYMRRPLPPTEALPREAAYWQMTLDTLGERPNVFCWEIANENLDGYAFQSAVGGYLRENDPWERPVCTSDGTTDLPAWPDEPFIDLAINHTCTGQWPLDAWYRALALNTRSHGKPAWCNESGREVRHKNDDGVHRRKQGWVWCASGCYWTHHSWDGCEGIDDPSYVAPGEAYLPHLPAFWRSMDWWRLAPSFTLVRDPGASPLAYAMQQPTPERALATLYLATEETGHAVEASTLGLLLPEGAYRAAFYRPADGAWLEEVEFEGRGLNATTPLDVPAYTDDLAVRIDLVRRAARRRMRGTR